MTRDAPSLVRHLLHTAGCVDRTQVSVVIALRNAVGVATPLAVGAATGQLLAGVTMAIGALNVAFLDTPGPYRQRAAPMLLAGLYGAASVFLGSATGASGLLAVVLTALWGFAGGLLVALGPVATGIGLTGIVSLLVFAGKPLAPDHAAIAAGLVLAGGVLQTTLAVAAWPVRPLQPQRAALATVFRQLATFARRPADPAAAPPVTAAITTASTSLRGLEDASSAAAESLRALLDETERIRLEVLALADARQHLGDAAETAGLRGWISSVLDATGAVLEALAAALPAGTASVAPETSGPLRRIEAAVEALQRLAGAEANAPRPVPAVAILAQVEALGGQLRAVTRLVTAESPEGLVSAQVEKREETRQSLTLRLRASLAILRANLTLRSTACRHALRLAGCVAVADALARTLALPRAYWVPMTAALVLKPDFAATFTRGLGRLAGTALGLLVTTALVHAVFGTLAGKVVLVGLLTFVLRSLGPANYGLFTIAMTGLVVVLTAFAGASPAATIVERGINTLLGGGLALGAYALWPTWERTQTPAVLADLCDAYRRYFAAVMAGYGDPGPIDHADLNAVRQAARVARTNAEASIERLRSEPAQATEEVDRAVGLLANAHRFVRGVMALEAGLYHDPASRPASAVPAAVQTFTTDVDTILRALAAALRHPSPLPVLPQLRADLRAWPGSPGPGSFENGAAHADDRLAVLAAEADRITDSVNTLIGLVRAEVGTTNVDLATGAV